MKISKAKHRSFLVCTACMHFIQGWRDKKPAKWLSFSPYSSVLVSVPRRWLHLFVKQLLWLKSKVCAPFCSAWFKELCGLWSSLVYRDLWGALDGEDAKMCKLRFLTQGCEDLALVSLSYSSPLAKHMPQVLWSCWLHSVLMIQLCLGRFSLNLLQIKISMSEKLIVVYSCMFNTWPLKIRYGFVISLWKMIVDYIKDCFFWFVGGWFFFCLSQTSSPRASCEIHCKVQVCCCCCLNRYWNYLSF